MGPGGQEVLLLNKCKKMRNNIKYLLIFTIAVFVFTIFYSPDSEKRCEKILALETRDEVIGRVVKKYYVKQNMYPYLEIRQSSDSSIVKKSFHAELSGIFDDAEIGDSIYKPAGSLVFTIIKDSIVTKLKFTMFCNK